jgi:hypothetical protein
MALRFTAEAGRIIISKPGFDASSSLPDANKIFDSNWFATGGIFASGTAVKPPGMATYTINFPPLHYVPAAVAYVGGFAARGTVTNSSIILDTNAASGEYFWVVWAVSQ